MPLVSVIVPVYNVEKYLSRCLDSILGQTEPDIEVICINDGSTDRSGDVLSLSAAKDPRIRIMDQNNQGASVARNKGLAEAKGDYVLFVDSDDSIHPQLLEITTCLARRHQAAMVSFGFDKVGSRDAVADAPDTYDSRRIRYRVTDTPLFHQKKRDKWKVEGTIWTRLHKRELIAGTRFMSDNLYEDYPHTYALLRQHPRTVLLREKLYHYTIANANSVSYREFTPKAVKDYHAGLNFIYEIYKNADRKDFRHVVRELIPNLLKQQLNKIERTRPDVQPALWKAFREELLDLDAKGLVRFRGNKLSRWLKYRRLIKGGSEFALQRKRKSDE